MKLPCEIIRDLLPLYHDGVCSEVSKTIVSEHLKTCESCSHMLADIHEEVDIPKPDTDEGKPLRAIRRKWRAKTRTRGILIGLSVFLVVTVAWFQLTQSSSVPIKPEEYTIETVLKFSNGMYYLEYSHPYSAISHSADIHRSESGAIHFVEYRPRVALNKKEGRVVRTQIIDPDHDTLYANTGIEVPLTAFYLGCPDEGEAVLLWDKNMDIPLATPEQEEEYLYKQISNW